ncbi:MAG: ROK family protein [Deltaproteobacteria bacterium]
MIATRSNKTRCGLDIGGTQIKSVILDDSFTVLEETSTPSNANLGPEHVREAILTSLKKLNQSGHQITHLGIGCAGSVDSKTGTVRNSPNFSHWKDINLKSWLSDFSDISVRVDNDANCATLAEWRLGKGQGTTNLILLTLGTGIGGGLILDNRLYRGSTGTGGELGHFSINTQGIACPCGNMGCFERYCSASALKSQLPEFTAKEIFDNRHSNEKCKIAVQAFLKNLKIGLTGLANIFDPDLILLGGAVSEGLKPFASEIMGWLKASAFPAVGDHVKIDFTLFGNNSGAIGAALLHDS